MEEWYVYIAVAVVVAILAFKFIVKPILKIAAVAAIILIAWLLLMN